MLFSHACPCDMRRVLASSVMQFAKEWPSDVVIAYEVASLSPRCASEIMDDEMIATVQKNAEKLVAILEAYLDGALGSATEWLEEAGKEMIERAKVMGQLDKILPPTQIFHRDGLVNAADRDDRGSEKPYFAGRS